MLRCRGILFNFGFWSGEQNFVPNMWQVVFAHISVESRVVHSNVDGLWTLSYSLPQRNKKKGGSVPFLDILVTPQEDGTLTSKVYRKPTHTDQYLQWDSHHNLACKYSVINTLTHRAKAVCSNSHLLKKSYTI